MEDKKREMLNEILGNAYYNEQTDVRDIKYDTIFKCAEKYGVSFNELIVFVFDSLEKSEAANLFYEVKSEDMYLADKLWENASEEKRYQIALPWVQTFLIPNWDSDVGDSEFFSEDAISIKLDLKMINYIPHRETQRNLFKSRAIEIASYYEFFERNFQSSDDLDEAYIDALECGDIIEDALKEFWSSLSGEMQADFMPDLMELYRRADRLKRSDTSCLRNCIDSSDKTALIKNLNDILGSGAYVKYDTISVEEKVNLIFNLINENKAFEKIWNDLPEEIQKENLPRIIEMISDKNILQTIWNNTDFSILNDLDIIKQFFDKYFIDVAEERKKENFEKYLELVKINDEINTTINFEIFDSPLFSDLSIDLLTKITNHPEIQSEILGARYGSDETRKTLTVAMIQYCLKHDSNMLDKLLENIDNLKYINFDKFSVDELTDEDTLSGLVNLCMMSENYFNVGRMYGVNENLARNAVLDFENWRASASIAILEDKKSILELFPIIDKMDSVTRKRFAMLQLKYGIDLKDAQILVRKYASGLEATNDLNQEETETRRQLLEIKQILSLNEEDLDAMHEKIKQNDYQEYYDADLLPVTDLEKRYIDVFARKYNETLYAPKDSDYTGVVNYSDKKIKIYEPKDDFNMFVRSEGAYNLLWSAPDDYKKDIQRPKVGYHGNCESYIAQNLIALAKPNGPIFAYANCSSNNMIAMAPYDLISNDANTAFSSINGDKTERGMDFRAPKEMIDRTRHGHNEAVFERLEYDEGTFKKRMPSYVVWIKEETSETEYDRENDENLKKRWEETKKAAAQLNIPIVMIDREYYAQKEEEKLEAMLSMYEGKTENADQISSGTLLQEMIVQFENNATGLIYSPKLKDKYFSEDKRQLMIDRVWAALEKKKENDYETYKQEMILWLSVLKDEFSKGFSVTGERVTYDEQVDYYKNLRERLQTEIEGFTETPQDRKKYLGDLCDEARKKRAELETAGMLAEQYKAMQPKNDFDEWDP